MNSKLVFFSNFIKKPAEVAAVSPSSKYVISKIMQNIDFSNAECIIEYGPGIGTITKPVLENLASDAKLLCLESNAKFCLFINKSIKDPRLIVVNDTAQNLDLYMKRLNIKNADYVLSGIPFSLIKKENKKDIIKKTKDSLRKGGKFIVYQQYNWHLKKYLDIYFKKISTDAEIRNIPPTLIFICEKI